MSGTKHTLLGGVLGAALAAGIFLLLGAGPGPGPGMGMGPGMRMGMCPQQPATMPCANPMACCRPAAMNPGPWHVTALAAGQSNGTGAILWNSQTGQTWYWNSGEQWFPIKRP